MSRVKYSTLDPLLRFHSNPAEGKWWSIEEPISAWWEGYELTVPARFETDLASIPRLARWLVPQVDHHVVPAVFHDLAYYDGHPLDRAQADKMFLDGMATVGVPLWKRWLMYAAVRAGGWRPWQAYRNRFR